MHYKKNDVVVSNLSPTDITLKAIEDDLYSLFGITVRDNYGDLNNIIRIVKHNNMTMEIAMNMPEWPSPTKIYRYTYGI